MARDGSHLTPDMNIRISLDNFHGTHAVAWKAKEKVQKGNLATWSRKKLKKARRALRAGQRLTNAESGSDAMFASSYHDEIALVEKELRKSKK